METKVKSTTTKSATISPKTGFDETVIKRLKTLATSDNPACLKILDSTTSGLSEQQAAARFKKYGPNEIHHENAPAWYFQLLAAFLTPFNGVLFIVALVSLLTDVFLVLPAEREYKTVILLTLMVLLSSLLRFWQEYRSNKAAEALKSMIKTTATVLRKPGEKKEISFKKLVPGDLVLLSAGDMIPADCRILQSKDLFIIQSSLTGEAMPIEKSEAVLGDVSKKSSIELDNICFMGTNVESGAATAMVVHTGNQTYLGSVSKAITGKRSETSFDKGVTSVSWLLIRFIIVMVPMVFLINGFTKGNWLDAFLFALTVAVGLTPEMLPMIVTTNLAKGALNMSKEKVIVKRLNAIQNIGAMDVLCTDKTGTLTMDKIVLELHLNVFGENDDEVLKWAYLNSFHQTGLKNLLDIAVLEHSEVHGLLEIEEKYTKVDEIPFDFQRRRMSVVLQQHTGKHLLICKGAMEELLPLCTQAFDPGDDRQLHIESDAVVPMDAKMHQTVIDTCQTLNRDGLRVLLVAIKEFENRGTDYSVADEKDLIFSGFIAFLDPPKASAKASIAAMQELGVSIKVLTGDNEIVTQKICKDVGIEVTHILLGAEIEQMSDADLKGKLEETNIMAKINPLQKSRIVKLLQELGHTVGFMGDGINDASALKDADVGISVDTAVDIAKESADIILLEKDLMVLRSGIIYGRQTFGNIIKYIKMAASSNFGNMFSVLGASALLPFLPMLPIQILTQNLLYDISQIAIPWDQMDKEFIEKPQKWASTGITRFMLFIGPISSIFDYATFAVLYFVFQANTIEKQSLFQSGWFVEGLLSQTLIIHMIRTRKIPFFQSWATAPVLALTTLVMAIAVYIPFSPFAADLRMQPLPLAFFPWLIGILLCYCLLTQWVKVWFIGRFAYWL